MNLQGMTYRLGEWLRPGGPEADVVVSSRIRLARNLADMPFTNRATSDQKAAIEKRVCAAVNQIGWETPLEYLSLANLTPLQRQFLVERQLISREIANLLEGPRGVAFDAIETVSIMVNEEDQIRLQVIRAGFELESAWETIDRLDDRLEQHLNYAFHDQFGYLTACPTNVGTGMRASVLLHLPALSLTKQIEKAFKALQKMNLVVRGLYGEGSRASGDFFQVSNQVTLGKSEVQALDDIRNVVADILRYERLARTSLLRDNRQGLQDRVARALGTMLSATMMTSDETLELLSCLRLGMFIGLIEDLPPNLLNQLFLQTQPAHLQTILGESLDGEERNTARAHYLRQKLREIHSIDNGSAG